MKQLIEVNSDENGMTTFWALNKAGVWLPIVSLDTGADAIMKVFRLPLIIRLDSSGK